MKRQIVMLDGAPNLETLRMELRVRVPYKYDQENYAYHPLEGGPTGTPGTLIGRTVSDILDAVNEERLMLPEGEVGFDEMLQIWDRHIREEGDTSHDEVDSNLPSGDYQKLFYEWVLVDTDGKVWSRTIDVEESSDGADSPRT